VTVADLIGFSDDAVAADADSHTFTGFGTLPDASPPEAIFPARSSAQFIDDIGPIVVGWTPRIGAQNYTVQMDDDVAFTAPVVFEITVDAPVTTAELLDAFEDGTYYWRVRANVTETDQWGCSSFERVMTTLHVYCGRDDCSSTPGPEPADPCGALDIETGNRTTPFRSVQRAIDVALVHRSFVYDRCSHAPLWTRRPLVQLRRPRRECQLPQRAE